MSSDTRHHSAPFLYWCTCWILLILFYGLGILFMLHWAMNNNLIIINAWLYILTLCIVFDLLIYKTVEVFLIHFLVFDTIKPRLKRIVKLSREIFYIKLRTVSSFNFYANPIYVNDSTNKDYKNSLQEKELSEKYVSVGHRGFRANHSGGMSDFTDLRVCQHMSATCRAARHSSLSHLPIAQILMRLDDVDIHMLRDAAHNGNDDASLSPGALDLNDENSSNENKKKYTNWCMAIYHAFKITNILTVLCLILSPKAQEMLYNFTVILCIPIIWTTFLIGAYYLYLYASYVYVYLAIALIVYMFINYFLLYPSKQRVSRALNRINQQGITLTTNMNYSAIINKELRYLIDRIFVNCGIVSIIQAIQSVSNHKFHIVKSRLFVRDWYHRLHQQYGHEPNHFTGEFKHSQPTTQIELVDEKKKEKELVVVKGEKDPKKKNHNLGKSTDGSYFTSHAMIPSSVVHEYAHLVYFNADWEGKWHIMRDHHQQGNILLLEQYVGGDWSDLLHLHCREVTAKVNTNVMNNNSRDRSKYQANRTQFPFISRYLEMCHNWYYNEDRKELAYLLYHESHHHAGITSNSDKNKKSNMNKQAIDRVDMMILKEKEHNIQVAKFTP